MRAIFPCVAITGSALFTGAMALVALVFGPFWQSLPPQDFLLWFATYSHLIGRAMALFIATALIGVAGSLALNWSSPDRQWWLAALSSMGVIIFLTVIWFLPTNADFTSGAMSREDVADTLDTWLMLHWLRVLLGFEVCVISAAVVVRAHQRVQRA